jgi:hypothetical protein
MSEACEGHIFRDLSREALVRLLNRIVPKGGLAARLAQAIGEGVEEQKEEEVQS